MEKIEALLSTSAVTDTLHMMTAYNNKTNLLNEIIKMKISQNPSSTSSPHINNK